MFCVLKNINKFNILIICIIIGNWGYTSRIPTWIWELKGELDTFCSFNSSGELSTLPRLPGKTFVY